MLILLSNDEFLKFLAEIQNWSLTLYGTATPPAVNEEKNSGSALTSATAQDILQNSIDDTLKQDIEVFYLIIWSKVPK